MILGLIEWVVVGLLIGFVGSKAVNLRDDDPNMGIGAAVFGAILVAFLYSIISGATVTAWDPWGVSSAAVGGVAAVVTWHLVRSHYLSHAGHAIRNSY